MSTERLFVNEYNLPKKLSNDELYQLLKQMNKGDDSARKKLIEHNIRLVLFLVTNKFNYIDYDKNELVSIGLIGLIKAINSYDLSKKIEFSTYATKCIQNEIFMFLRKINKIHNIDSLDRPISNDTLANELTLKDIVSGDEDFTEKFMQNESYQIIHKIINELSKRDRTIIIMYFGFCDGKRYTQIEIANKLNVSQSYISRLIGLILKKMRVKLIEQGFTVPKQKLK